MASENLKNRSIALSALLALSISLSMPAEAPAFAADQSQIIGLNNDGVKALNTGNFQLAIQKFEEALKLDPNYQLARDNLAIAHNNYGLQLRNNPKEALKQFHKALYLNPANPTTNQNVDGIIKMLGKNPNSFEDRVELGDQARLGADFVGAILEYGAAIRIKNDPKIHVKLGDVYRVRNEDDKAIKEYQAAAAVADTAEIELKLGQAYQSKKDIPDAIAAYGKAIALKPDDPDVLDGLVAGWEEALKESPFAPENHIGLGQALQYRGDFGQAEEEYKQAIRFSPGKQNATAQRLLAALPAAKAAAMVTKHINQGVDFQTKKLYDQAIQEYNLALQADPRNVDAVLNRGTAEQQKGDLEAALKDYKVVLSMQPNNQAAQEGVKTVTTQLQDKFVGDAFKQAGELFKQGKFGDAAAQYLAVLKFTPDDAATHYSLGACYQAMKNYDQAIGEYKIAIGKDPKNKAYTDALNKAYSDKAEPIIQAAVKEHEAKNYAGAIDLYTQALQITPKNASLWYNAGSAEYSRQNYQAAKADYQKALDIDPKGQVNNLYLNGTIEENFGNGGDAKTDYQKYLSAAPTGTYAAAAKERLTALNKDIHDTIKIKSEAELALQKKADDAYNAAVKAQTASQFDQAIQSYQEAIGANPKNPDFHYSLGTCYQQKGDMDNAITEYKTALSMTPTNKDFQKALDAAIQLKADPLIEKAVQLQQKGDLPGAVEAYNQALQLVPNNARVWSNLGTALQASDNFDQAYTAYQKATTLDPKNEGSDFYWMAKIDENRGKGSQSIKDYQDFLRVVPTGNYTDDARARIKDLSANPSATQKLQTAAEAKGAAAADAAYQDGVKLQNDKKYDEAAAKYQEAIAAAPSNVDYIFALATDYQAKGDLDNAIAAYQKAQALAPKNADIKKYMDMAIQAKAAPLMDDAVKKHEAKDYDAAIPLYEQALKIAPSGGGYLNLAGAYQAKEDWQHAYISYQKAEELDPKGQAQAFYFMGALDETMNDGRKAIADYQKYLSADPKGPYAAAAQGRVSSLRVDPTKVQKIATQAEIAKSSEGSSAYDAGVKAQGENKLDDAIANYDKAIASAPSEPAYYYARGTAYQAKNDFDKALADYEKAANLNPKEPSYTNVIKQLKQAKAAPLVNSGIEKQTKNDLPGAIADYEASLKMYEDPATLAYLGTAYQGQNKLDKAKYDYDRAIQLDPKLPDPYYYRGTLWEQLKQPAKAVADYERYVRLAPTGPNAKDCKDRLKILAPGRR